MQTYSAKYPEGLTTSQAEKRLLEYGPGELSAAAGPPAGKIFFSQFKNLLTIILLAAAGVSLLMGEYTESVTIMIIVLLDSLLGFAQEYKTERTLELLRRMAAPTATVLRDGCRQEIPASRLVPDDIVLLEAGCRVPADGAVIESCSLAADESLLTGESLPAEKRARTHTPAKSGPGLPDMAYMGTVVTSGRGKMEVSATGRRTEMGGIADMLKNITEGPTPLQRRLDVLSRYIAASCLAICAAVTFAGILRGEAPFNMFLTGLSLAVAAIPEGLSAVITISLGLAVSRMLKQNALVRRLHAVETLGCADVICSDKTGTLTENRMSVRETYAPGGSPAPVFYEIALFCGDAEVRQSGAGWEAAGDPTECALAMAALHAGLLPEGCERVAELPFDSDRKLMSVAARLRDGRRLVLTKGAPDVLISRCDRVFSGGEARPMTDTARKAALAANDAMAGKALRVLGLAYSDYGGGAIKERGLVFAGLAGMLDPPRPEAAAAIRRSREAGVRTVMITGDHAVTARAVAEELGLMRPGCGVMTGAQMDALDDRALAKAVEKTAVFARVSPAHKLRIVRALKASGHIVAMTGDGVNDAPAVKEADIGVAMGRGGTDVTREAADLVLLDDDFSTLVRAVEEGRIVYRNIRKFIRYLLACNTGEVVTMFFGMLMGMPVVLLPIQILMVNLVTDGLPAVALGLDPPQDDVMREPPRPRGESVFSEGLATKIIFRGLLLGISVLAVFAGLLGGGASLPEARTAAFLTLVLTQLVHVFECKSERRPLFRIKLWNNVWLVLAAASSLAAVLAAIYVPALWPVFDTVPLSWGQLLACLAATFAAPAVSAAVNEADYRRRARAAR